MKHYTLLTKSLLQTLLFSINSAKWVKLKFAVVCLLTFDFLFYDGLFAINGLGLNIFIFSLLLVATSFLIHKRKVNDHIYLGSSFALLISSLNIFYLHSSWSIMVYILSLFSLVGSMYNPKSYNIIISIIQSCVLYISHPINFALKTLSLPFHKFSNRSIALIYPYVIIPVAIVCVFGLLYTSTNTVLKDFVLQFPTHNNWISNFFSFSRVFLWVLFFLVFGIFFISPFGPTILDFGDFRKKIINEERKRDKANSSILGLTQELNTAKISLTALNILLFLILSFDLVVFFSSSLSYSAQDLSKMVHSGTYIVSFTIALSCFLVFIFFRKNLNFHPKKAWLIRLSKMWLGLNTVYLMLVIGKNMSYIFNYGLTSKRLSLIIFLASCLALLIYAFKKIDNKWTIPYTLNKFLATFAMIVVAYSSLDHKAIIVNFASYVQTQNIDTNYLSNLCSDRQFLLYSHMENIEKKAGSKVTFRNRKPKSKLFPSWKSYNYILSKENIFYGSQVYKELNQK